jgi:hypothetical protein
MQESLRFHLELSLVLYRRPFFQYLFRVVRAKQSINERIRRSVAFAEQVSPQIHQGDFNVHGRPIS